MKRRWGSMLHSVRRSSPLVPFLLAALSCPGAAGQHPRVDAKQACVSQACHASSVLASGTAGSAHEPFSSGDCRACHDLSLSPGASFVRGAPSGPGEGSERARAWDLALCTGCHGEGLLAPDALAGATGFVDGARNLHAHHVQAGRGRRCLPCHDPHAARQPKLLRERIPARGGAQIAQKFRSEPKGGWCKTGCHAPKSYKR